MATACTQQVGVILEALKTRAATSQIKAIDSKSARSPATSHGGRATAARVHGTSSPLPALCKYADDPVVAPPKKWAAAAQTCSCELREHRLGCSRCVREHTYTHTGCAHL